MASTWVAHCGGKRRPSVGWNSPMRGETIWTVAPCSLSQRWAPMISTSSTPLVQQMATRLPLSRVGFEGGSNRKALSSWFSSPSAVTRSSVEIDGTGEVDISCCMRVTCVACVLIFHAPQRGSERNLLERAGLFGERDLDRQPLHRAGAVEAVDARHRLQDVGGILGRGDRPA